MSRLIWCMRAAKTRARLVSFEPKGMVLPFFVKASRMQWSFLLRYCQFRDCKWNFGMLYSSPENEKKYISGQMENRYL